MAVLLIGDGDLYEMNALKQSISDHSAKVHLCDVNQWPGGPPLTVNSTGTDVSVQAQFDVGDISAVYVQYYELFSPFTRRFVSELRDEFVSTFFQLREHRELFMGLFRMIEYNGGNVIPDVDSSRWHDRKPWQLHLFESVGIPTPDTMFTTDPEEAIDFCERHDTVVHKTITNGGLPSRIDASDLTDEKLQKLETAPVLFQEFVEGEDLRVYVLDGEVIGAFRYKCDSYSYKIDIKEDNEESITYERLELPEPIERDVLRATDAADLQFAAADVRRRKDGSYAMLEVNDTPRFKAADSKAGLDIAERLGEYLASHE